MIVDVDDRKLNAIWLVQKYCQDGNVKKVVEKSLLFLKLKIKIHEVCLQ
jgi:hypothetical protein